MGTCVSCEAALATRSATVKLVLPDGGFREFARPVRASHALEGEYHACVVCDGDEMEIGGFVSAIGDEEELRLDQIYFVLPRSMLKRRLRAEEIAALAVRANAAIARAVAPPPPPPQGGRWRRRAVAPMVFPAVDEAIGDGEGEGEGQGEGAAKDEAVVEEEETRRGRSEKRVRGRKFFPDLSAIPE